MMRITRRTVQMAGRFAILAAVIATLAFGVVAVVGLLSRPPEESQAGATPATQPAPAPKGTADPSAPSESSSSSSRDDAGEAEDPEPTPPPPTKQTATPSSPRLPADGPQRLQLMIAEGQIDQMLELGNIILADDPENLNVVHALAFQLRHRELMASPRNYAHAAEAVDLSRKAIGLVESGRTLAGVENFDKNATLAWLYQNLAVVESRSGMSDTAIEHYERSTSFAPLEPDIAGRNLAELLAWRQATFTEAVGTYNALPDEARGADEPSAEVAAARDALNAEADALIDVAARLVVLAEVNNLPQATQTPLYAALESAYRMRNPDDAEAAGLQAVIDSKK